MKRLLRRLQRFQRQRQRDLIWLLDDWLIAAQGSARPWVRERLTALLFELRRFIKLLFCGLRLEIVLLKGHAEASRTPLTVAYVGEGDGLAFLQHTLFEQGAAERHSRGRCALWRGADKALALADEADLVLLEHNSLYAWRPPCGEWHSGPTWVRMVRDFAPGEEWEQVKRSMQHQAKNIRRVRGRGYSYRISYDEADFEFFYHRMYVPFITGRHQDHAIISKQDYLGSFFRRGMLVMVLNKAKQAVAASLCLVSGDVVYVIVGGILDGDPCWMREGAMSALYYFTIRWAHQHGIRHIDWGRNRPFLTDGIFSHKKRWGLEIGRDLWGHSQWLFWVPNGSPAAQAWLKAHPFVPSVSQSATSATATPSQ